MNKVAIGRVVLTNREHIIALEPMDKGLMGTLLRYPYEVRSADEYFIARLSRVSEPSPVRSAICPRLRSVV
jgi:non-homologous end joining protein Ku